MSTSSSKHRVFSHKDFDNYGDYLKIKNGETQLKNKKQSTSSNKNESLRHFISYHDFLNITKAYYKHKNNHLCDFHLLTDIYNTNISFIIYQKILEHVNNCNYCSEFSNPFLPLNVNKISCEQLLNILYPYGVYKSILKSNIYFPNKINLDEWCTKKNVLCETSDQYIDTNIQNNYHYIIHKHHYKSNCGSKYGLCKDSKPLFI